MCPLHVQREREREREWECQSDTFPRFLKSGTLSKNPIHKHRQILFRPTKSVLQTIASILPPFAPVKEEGGIQKGETERETERERGIHLFHRSGLSGLCERPVCWDHRDWASWSSRSYNTVDKKLRAQPSGNLRGGVSRPGRVGQPQNI